MTLSTSYLGLTLKHPLIASASPLSRTLEGIRELEDAGAAAIVLYSLFAEQILMDEPSAAASGFAPALSDSPDWNRERFDPEGYLDLIRLAKRTVGIPVIGSLNGVAGGDWTRYAAFMEEAGADALELNLYHLPTDSHVSGADMEQRYLDEVADVASRVHCPIAVKIGPYFSALPHMAHRFAEAGADALVLFNRFYQADIDLETGRPAPRLVLSDSDDLRLPLFWISTLAGDVPVDFALTGGIHTHEDVLKAVMAGASAVMTTSELLQHGRGRLQEIVQGIQAWMTGHGMESLDELRGRASRRSALNASAFARAGYVQELESVRTTN